MANWKDIRVVSREDMMKRVARFKKLKGSDGGLPDSPLPESKRTLFAVIGFQPPKKNNKAHHIARRRQRLNHAGHPDL